MAQSTGTFLVSWSQTAIDGRAGAPVGALANGALWNWRGEPARIGGPSEPTEKAVWRAREAVGQVLAERGLAAPRGKGGPVRTFVVTDGLRRWTAMLLDMPPFAHPFLVFAGTLPPRERSLLVTRVPLAATAAGPLPANRDGVICFTPGTRIETAEGPRRIEELVAGDRVVTRDNGAQEVLWVGERHLSSARLLAAPELRPVCIGAGALGGGRPVDDLVVSPDHRILVQGAEARALTGEHEVLVAARDLVDGVRITRDRSALPVTYHHLMLAEHGLVVANGMEAESFHPGTMALDRVAEEQLHRLYDVMPGLRDDPAGYGPMSRRVLNRNEALQVLRAS